jgi:hypothetical protein
MIRGFKVTPSTEIYFTIEVQVRVIYYFNRYRIRILLREINNESVNFLAFHNTALIGIIPPSRRDSAYGLVYFE